MRTKTQRLEQIKAYWLEANWKLCLELRQGADFQTVTRAIMTEQHALQAALQKELPAPMPKVRPQAPTTQPKNEPYRTHSGQGHGGQKRWASQDPRWQRHDKKQDTRSNQSHDHNGGTGSYTHQPRDSSGPRKSAGYPAKEGEWIRPIDPRTQCTHPMPYGAASDTAQHCRRHWRGQTGAGHSDQAYHATSWAT